MRRRALLLVAALAFAPLAARGDILDKARMLAEQGRAFHDAGDYSHAIAAFTQAYVLAPSPALLFNLAQAYRLQGNCNDAALMYRRYLATNPEPEQRALAETHLASVERCIHKLALHIPVEPGTRSELAPKPSQPRSATLAATRDAPATSRRAQLEKDVGIGVALGGSVALAVAAYYAVQAYRAADDVTATYARGGQWQDIASIDARGRSAATRAKLFGAGGALGVAGGVVTYLLGKRDEPPLTVAPARHGLSIGMRWTF